MAVRSDASTRIFIWQGAVFTACLLLALGARWAASAEPSPEPVPSLVRTPSADAAPPAPAALPCEQKEASKDLDRWEAARVEAEGEITRLEGLRAALEGAPDATAPQDPETLEGALLRAAASQQTARVSLDSIDCSEYPCVAVFRSDAGEGGFRMDHMMDGLGREPGWADRTFGGMHTWVGSSKAVVLLTIWEEPPNTWQEQRAMSRIGNLVAQARLEAR